LAKAIIRDVIGPRLRGHNILRRAYAHQSGAAFHCGGIVFVFKTQVGERELFVEWLMQNGQLSQANSIASLGAGSGWQTKQV
jgi:hypothetical protein